MIYPIQSIQEISIYRTFPIYVVNLPDEAIPKIRRDSVSGSQKTSSIKRSISSKSELEELSIGGLIDIFVLNDQKKKRYN